MSDVEDLISHLANSLHPTDRTAFRKAAEAALQNEPPCGWGPGSIHRAVATIWRSFFDPPATKGEWTCWESGKKKQSRLIAEGAKDYGRARRMRIVK